MKTPEEIARDIIGGTLKDDGKVVRVNPSIVFRWIERAVYYERREQETYELADHVEAIKKYLKENELPDMTRRAFVDDLYDVLRGMGRMFNSQKNNNDPNPYKIVNIDGNIIGRVSNKVPNGYVSCRFEPREEYDNNPNPILEQFREDFTGDMAGWSWWFLDVAKEMFHSKECTHEHIDHARKVLEKLVNVYG